MLSTDQHILEIGSSVYVRMREYAELVDELHIVVLCAKKTGVELHDSNLHVYPTNSEKKVQRIFDAYKIAAGIIEMRAFSESDSLISCQDPFELGLIGVRLKKRFGLKLQLQVHTDFANKFFVRESFKNKARYVIAWRTLARADGIRVVSERIKKTLLALGGPRFSSEKVSVLPIFTDIDAITATEAIDLHSRFPHFKKIILMASRLTHEKQVVWACSALESVAEKYPDLGIVILGDGPERAVLEKISYVRVAGWTDNVVSYMKGADLFLNTSLYEGYGRTLVEAAASGVPVVTTDVGVAPEIFENGKTGILITPLDAPALSAAVLSVIEGRVMLSAPQLPKTTKFAYLQAYLETWRRCL